MTIVTTVKNIYCPIIIWFDDVPVITHKSYFAKTLTSYRGPNLGKYVTHPCSMTQSRSVYSGMSRFERTNLGQKKTVVWSGRHLAAYGIAARNSGALPFLPNYSSYDVSRAMSGIVEKVWAKASQPYLPAVHYTGEIMETVRALKSPMAGIRTVLESARSRLKKRAPWSDDPFSKQIAGAYLEHTFGTMPNVAMAKTLAEAAAESVVKVATDSTKRHAAKVTFPIADDETATCAFYVWGLGTFYYEATLRKKVTLSTGMYVRHLGNFTTKPNLASIAAEGWELLPLSFVANWFVNVSQLLKECRPVPGTILGSWQTQKLTEEVTYKLVNVVGSSYYSNIKNYTGDSAITMSKTTLKREVDICRTGTLHLGAGLNSIGKGFSLLALARQKF